MAMKMDRRAFLKTSAAVAVAVSMTGLLGGCGSSAIGTDFGPFQATAVKLSGSSNADDLDATEWKGEVKVWVRIKDVTNDKKPQPLAADRFFVLNINGQKITTFNDGGLLSDGGKIKLGKGEFKENWIHFALTADQKELYEAIKAKTAKVTVTIWTPKKEENYTLDYTLDYEANLVKQTV